MQDPNVRSRGGYTPLMVAGQGGKEEVYSLLVAAYHADEAARDYSGRTAAHWLQQRRRERAHPSAEDAADGGGARRSRRAVARSATQTFLKEFRESVRDVRGSLRDNWLRPKSSSDF